VFSIPSPRLGDRKHTTRWIKIIITSQTMGDPIYINNHSFSQWFWLRIIPFALLGYRAHGGCDRSTGNLLLQSIWSLIWWSQESGFLRVDEIDKCLLSCSNQQDIFHSATNFIEYIFNNYIYFIDIINKSYSAVKCHKHDCENYLYK
jgi:hypothetical protein